MRQALQRRRSGWLLIAAGVAFLGVALLGQHAFYGLSVAFVAIGASQLRRASRNKR